MTLYNWFLFLIRAVSGGGGRTPGGGGDDVVLRGEPDDGHLLGLHTCVSVFGQQEDYGLFRCSVLGLYNTRSLLFLFINLNY